MLVLIPASTTLLIPLLDQVHSVDDQGTQCQYLSNVKLKDPLQLPLELVLKVNLALLFLLKHSLMLLVVLQVKLHVMGQVFGSKEVLMFRRVPVRG